MGLVNCRHKKTRKRHDVEGCVGKGWMSGRSSEWEKERVCEWEGMLRVCVGVHGEKDVIGEGGEFKDDVWVRMCVSRWERWEKADGVSGK